MLVILRVGLPPTAASLGCFAQIPDIQANPDAQP
jgi:hypothetical protein